jgi:Na+/H+ antiporter NhaD/arsenite permease-like protein
MADVHVPAPTAPAPTEPDRALEVAERIAHWMDHRFLDPLLGLILPGIGDLVGAAMGIYPVLLAWRRRAPKSLLARMLLNLAADAAGGAVPVVGDLWDFVFKAHARNLALLRSRSSGQQVRSRWTDGLVLVLAVLVLLAALALPVVVAIGIWRAFTHH